MNLEQILVNTIGVADSTLSGYKSALKIHDAYRHFIGVPVAMNYDEIRGENLQLYFTNFLTWLSTTPIPIYGHFDDNMLPTNPSNKQRATVRTLLLYIGKVFKAIRQVFPNHEDYKNKDVDTFFPDWYSSLRKEFDTEHTRFTLDNPDGELVFGVTKTRPLYRDNGKLFGKNPFSYCDLTHMFQEMMHKANKTNHLMEERMQLLMIYLAMGRVGEVRFQNYKDWEWHQYLEVLNQSWTEMKKLQKYAMPMVPDYESFYFDIYHAMGCYIAVDFGLVRTPEQKNRGMENVVFPSLYNVKTNSVARKIQNMIQKVLRWVLESNNFQNDVIVDVIKCYSGKSLRQSSITEVSNSDKITIFDEAARTGHTTGTSIDNYRDKTLPTHGLRCAKLLAKMGDVNGPICVPTFEALGTNNYNMARLFMHALFPNEVNIFGDNKALEPILEICCASMIMFHNDVVGDIGYSNIVPSIMYNAAVKVQLHDQNLPMTDPRNTLKEWSKLTKLYIKEKRTKASFCTGDIDSITRTMNEVVTSMHCVQTDLRLVKQELGDAQSHNIRLESENQHLRQNELLYVQRVNELERERDKAKRKHDALQSVVSNHLLSSPTAQANELNPKRLCVDASFSVDNNNDDDTQITTTTAGGDVATGTTTTTIITTPPVRINNTNSGGLFWKHEANRRSAGKTQKNNNDGTSFSSHLYDIVSAGSGITRLPRKPVRIEAFMLSQINLKNYQNKHFMVKCMELGDLVITTEQKNELYSNDQLKIKKAAHAIESAMMKKMAEFEGYSEADVKALRAKNKWKATNGYTGIGTRVTAYKKLLHERMGSPKTMKPIDVRLVPFNSIEDLRTTGTPPGNRSIRTMLKISSNNNDNDNNDNDNDNINDNNN